MRNKHPLSLSVQRVVTYDLQEGNGRVCALLVDFVVTVVDSSRRLCRYDLQHVVMLGEQHRGEQLWVDIEPAQLSTPCLAVGLQSTS